MELFTDWITKTFGTHSSTFNSFSQYIDKLIKDAKDPEICNKWCLKNNTYSISNQKSNKEVFIRNHYGAALILEILKHFNFKINPECNLILPFRFMLDKDFDMFPNISKSLKAFSEVIDYFGDFIGNLLYPSYQNELGMVYTPFYLCNFVLNQFIFKKNSNLSKNPPKIIDPTCGSGRFILSYLDNYFKRISENSEKINLVAIQNVYANDVNPLAILSAYANCVIYLIKKGIKKPFLQEISNNFQLVDLSELESSNSYNHLKSQFDYIIGNLPWNVLNDVKNQELREKIEFLGKKYELFMTWKNRSNSELATILLRISAEILAKAKGILIFLLPASILTGSQHAKFRRFENLTDLEVLRFKPDIFPIHSLIFKAEVTMKEDTKYIEKLIQVRWYNFDIHSHKLSLINRKMYHPSYVNFHRKRALVGKYIEIKSNEKEIIIQKSYYYDKIYRGPDITPRSLLFIQNINSVSKSKQNLVEITPVTNNIASTQSKKWDFHPYLKSIISKDQIFDIIKSTDLIPYHLVSKHHAFLPIIKGDLSYHIASENEMSSESWKHYEYLEKIYQKYQKKSAKNQTLSQSLKYGKKLENPELLSPLKVIYPVGGSLSKAAIIRNPSLIVDVTFYYLTPNSEEEAYYLLGWLNSPLLHKNLPRVCTEGARGSIRVIHLTPWMFPLPKFDEENQVHLEIASNVKILEMKIQKSYIKENLLTNSSIIYSSKRAPVRNAYNIIKNSGILKNLQKTIDSLYLGLFE